MSRFLKHGLIVAALLALVVRADAEDGTDNKPAGDVTVAGSAESRLSADEMKKRSAKMITRMKTVLGRALKLQKIARNKKDIIKLNCVNDKLLQIKQLLNIAESARTNLVEAMTVNNKGEAHHQYGQVTISHDRGNILKREAEECLGEPDLDFLDVSEGDTIVETEKPPIVDDPTAENPFDIGDTTIGGSEEQDPIERPGYATPFI